MNLINQTLEKVKQLNCSLIDNAQIHLDNLTKPQGSLGRLEELAKKIVGIQNTEKPCISNKVIITMASDHGVSDENVSAYPKVVTAQMVYNFLNGGAAINILAKHIGARILVVDMGVASKLKTTPKLISSKIAYGTQNMALGTAMTKDEAIKSIQTGIDIVESLKKENVDIIGTGDMGIGNTTSSSAITAVVTQKNVEDVTGKGTGINNETLNKKISIIKNAIDVNKPNNKDGLDILSKVGGFEIGGLAGVIIACASMRIPVVIDGFVSGAAALIAYILEPKIKDYIIASHCSVEKGHKVILDFLGIKPLFDLEMRLGEGTGAALGISIVDASVKLFNEMATFSSAGVSIKTS